MKTLLLLLAFVMPTVAKSQANQTHSTNSNEGSRFMIVQSPIAVRLTFKLDTYTGDVYQMVIDANGKNLWQHVDRNFTSLPDTRLPETKNYDLFVSTLGMRYTFLINTNSGATWQLTEDTNMKTLFFAPMIDN